MFHPHIFPIQQSDKIVNSLLAIVPQVFLYFHVHCGTIHYNENTFYFKCLICNCFTHFIFVVYLPIDDKRLVKKKRLWEKPSYTVISYNLPSPVVETISTLFFFPIFQMFLGSSLEEFAHSMVTTSLCCNHCM